VSALLDTTILIDVLRARNERRELLQQMVSAGETLYTSAINVGEVYAGMRPHEARMTDSLLNSLHSYAITPDIAKRAGMLQYSLAREGKTRLLADLIVAVTAMEYGLPIATDNRKDFEETGVSFYLVD